MEQSWLFRRTLGALIAVWAIAHLTGCGYNTVSDRFMQPYAHGDYKTGGEEAGKLAEKADRKDKLVFYLEQGAILRAGGQLEASTTAFERADRLVDEFDAEADVKISREAVAAVSNLSTLDYTGYGYDRIMMNVYKSLNYMEQGQLDNARVELKRAYDQQQLAVRRNGERIEEAQALKEKGDANKPDSVDVEQSTGSDDFKKKLSANVTSSLADFSGYADYVNPFAEWLQGMFFLTTQTSASDRGQAATALKRVAGMISDPQYVIPDLDYAENLPAGTDVPPVVYVIVETGLAPKREEVRLDIPLFLVSKRLPYAGVAFPKLKVEPNFLDNLAVSTSAGRYPLVPLANMDAVVSREFSNDLPMVITKTIIAAATKAAISYTANEAVKKQDSMVQLVVFASTFIVSAALTQADLRSWNSLPKKFEMARFSPPDDRSFTLQLPYGVQKGPNATVGPIKIIDGVVNVIYIKSVQPGSPLIVRQFKLK